MSNMESRIANWTNRFLKTLILVGLLSIFFWGTAYSVRANNDAPEIKIEPPGGLATLLSPFELFGGVARTLIGLMGVVALVIFVIGGVTWLASAGNPERVKKAKDIMIWAVIGILVILGSFVILSTIFRLLPGPAAPSAPVSTPQQLQEPAGTVESIFRPPPTAEPPAPSGAPGPTEPFGPPLPPK